MICRRCGADVAPTKFCSKCGTLLNGKRCNSCGAIMGVNEGFCAECGTPAANYNYAPAQDNYPPQYGQGGNPQAGRGNQEVKPMLKKRSSKDIAPMGNKHTVLRGLVGSLASLGALGVMVYFYVFGDLMGGFSPFILDAGTLSYQKVAGEFSLFSNYTNIIEYFKTFAASMRDFGTLMPNLLENIPVLLFELAYLLGAVMLVVAVLIAIIRFLTGILGKKEFDLMLPIKLALGGFLSMYFAILLTGKSDELFSYTSGLAFGIYAGAAAILVQIILNIALAGKRFGRGGAIMKWLSNIGFFAGAVIMMFAIPLTLNIGGAEVSPIEKVVEGVTKMLDPATATEVDMVNFGLVAYVAAFQISAIWALPTAALNAGKRAARTFKFDGYADKGCLLRGFAAMLGAISMAVVVFMLCDGDISGIILFALGGVMMFVFGLINKMFLNKDQLG